MDKEKFLREMANNLRDEADDILREQIDEEKMQQFEGIDFYNEGLRAVIKSFKDRLDGGW